MPARVGINGFGRIGRQVFKAIHDHHPDNIEVVAVNDLTDPKTNAHLLKYDSTYGAFPGEISAVDGAISVDGQRVKVIAERDPASIPWHELGVELVVEATGRFFETLARDQPVVAIFEVADMNLSVRRSLGHEERFIRNAKGKVLVGLPRKNRLFETASGKTAFTVGG